MSPERSDRRPEPASSEKSSFIRTTLNSIGPIAGGAVSLLIGYLAGGLNAHALGLAFGVVAAVTVLSGLITFAFIGTPLAEIFGARATEALAKTSAALERAANDAQVLLTSMRLETEIQQSALIDRRVIAHDGLQRLLSSPDTMNITYYSRDPNLPGLRLLPEGEHLMAEWVARNVACTWILAHGNKSEEFASGLRQMHPRVQNFRVLSGERECLASQDLPSTLVLFEMNDFSQRVAIRAFVETSFGGPTPFWSLVSESYCQAWLADLKQIAERLDASKLSANANRNAPVAHEP